MAAQECPDRGGRTSEAELCQFPLNPLISPPRVLASQSQNQPLRRLVEGRSARPAAGPAGPLPSDELAVPAKHGLGRVQEGAPGLSRQVAARGGEEEAVAPTKRRPADLPPEHVQLVAQDHDLQVLGIPAPPQKQREESPQDQGRERPDHGGPSLLRCCLDPTSRQLESRSRISVPFRHQPRSLWGFWNFLGAGVFGFLINLPIVSYYEIGTALTANHAHAAMMGVYGMSLDRHCAFLFAVHHPPNTLAR